MVANTVRIRYPKSLHLAWIPRVDGVFLTASPMDLVQQGAITDVPFIAGMFFVAQFPFVL